MRYCFTLQVREDLVEEYTEKHRHVWPEMQAALSAAGWKNYSLFLRPDGLLVGYVESDDFLVAQQAMARTEVNKRWQDEMSFYFVDLGYVPPDQAASPIPEVFHLQ